MSCTFDRFSEWDVSQKKNAWFKVKSEMSFFAEIWQPWTGERLKDVGKNVAKEHMIHGSYIHS